MATAEDIFQAAERMTHMHPHHGSPHIRNRRFKGLFGVSATVCSVVWNMLAEDNAHPVGGKLVHLLWACLFLKQYCTEEMFASVTNSDEKTFRQWSWQYINTIAYNLDVVRFDMYL